MRQQSAGTDNARETDVRVCIIVLAHNEERRIASCLASLPIGQDGTATHVVVNGSSDRTADIARGFDGAIVHDWEQGGKSRSWNRIMFDTPGIEADNYVFVDGDAVVLPGSVEALVRTLEETKANAASGLPTNGRRVAEYRESIVSNHGLFGDLYALSGEFVSRMRALRIRLPEDLIGDDGLICALAKTDLGDEADWVDQRVAPCVAAEFLCEPISPNLGSLRSQAARMRNYSRRHFQNRIISDIMRGRGPQHLPETVASLYSDYSARLRPRRDWMHWWFDRAVLQEIRSAAAA